MKSNLNWKIKKVTTIRKRQHVAIAIILSSLLFFCLDAVAQNTEKLYLSGTGEDHTVLWKFYCTEGQNSGKWTTIPVPSNWELQGFGKYNYGFAKDADRGKEKGLYQYNFSVPAAWKGKLVRIVFEGAMTDTEVKINGKSAGPTHYGSYYRFAYDISSLLKYGAENLLEATVAKHSENESVNKAERRGDFWIFGGIFRPVYLEVLPQQHIERLAVNATANGNFNAKVFVDATSPATTVSAQLFTADGKKTGAPFTAKISGDTADLHTLINTPKLWTPESPNLYSVQVSLLLGGKVIHTIKAKFGFRTIQVRQHDGVYINGVKVKFKGVCRHSFYPSSGRTLSEHLSVLDVQLMKDMNMNAVRLSHYPADEHFYDACDSLGLFVIDELAGWHGNYDTETGSPLVKAMVEKDANHPCIIFWANGNEGGHNTDFDPLFTMYDMQHRPVIHPWQDFGGFDTQHYREYDYGIGNYMHGHDIVMPTEFLHGLYDGGHAAGLEDYWEAMWRSPLAAGGFLWDFSDEGVVRTDKNGELDTDGNHGADGILGPYREKEGSYFAIKEIWSPVYIFPKEVTPEFDGKITIENRYFFTNTAQCSFTWKLSSLAAPNKNNLAKTVSGTATSPDIKPGIIGNLQLRLPANWSAYDVLYITAFNPFHREIFTWSFPIERPKEMASSIVAKEGTGTVNCETSDSLYTVSVNGARLTFARRTGLLQSVQNSKGVIPFNNGPVLQDGINNFQNFSQYYEGKNLVIESAFDKKNSYNRLQWTVYPSGWVKLQVQYFPSAYFTTMPGINFSFPESEVKSIQWLGDGPYRVWKNRMKGGKLTVWKKAYNNTSTGEAPFIYPEFKGYYDQFYWCTIQTSSQPITIVTETEDLFLRLFTPKFSAEPYNTAPPFPSGDISFLQGIPAIGTKTQKPETTGPMGQPYSYYDYEKDPQRYRTITLYFDFSGHE